MNDMQKYLSLIALVSFPLLVTAQAYNTAVGLRVGRSGGATLAQRLSKNSSAEVYLATGIFDDGTTITLLGRRHMPLITRKLNLFVGAGVHKGWGYTEDGSQDGILKKGNPFGFDGQVGAEVSFGRTNIAFDYNVQVNLSGSLSPIRPPGAAISIRYVIDKRENKLKVKLPWAEENKATQKAREKRKKERAKAKRKKERIPLKERLGLNKAA